MAADQFITVLSNYNQAYFRDNEPASFKNIVSNELIFDKESEVSLIELSLKFDFEVRDKQASVYFFDFLFTTDGQSFGKDYEATLDDKCLNNGYDVCNELNNLLYKKCQRLKDRGRAIFYWGTNNRIWMRFHPQDFLTIVLREKTLQIIGK